MRVHGMQIGRNKASFLGFFALFAFAFSGPTQAQGKLFTVRCNLSGEYRFLPDGSAYNRVKEMIFQVGRTLFRKYDPERRDFGTNECVQSGAECAGSGPDISYTRASIAPGDDVFLDGEAEETITIYFDNGALLASYYRSQIRSSKYPNGKGYGSYESLQGRCSIQN